MFVWMLCRYYGDPSHRNSGVHVARDKKVSLRGIQFLSEETQEKLRVGLPYRQELTVEAEPDNEHDRNSIRVLWDGLFVGRLPRSFVRGVRVSEITGLTVISIKRDAKVVESKSSTVKTKETIMKKSNLEQAKVSGLAAAGVMEMYLTIPVADLKTLILKDGKKIVTVEKPEWRARALFDTATGQFVPTKRFFNGYNKERKVSGWQWSDSESLMAFQKLQLDGGYMDVPLVRTVAGVGMKGKDGLYSTMLSLFRREAFDIVAGEKGACRVVDEDYLAKFSPSYKPVEKDEELVKYLSL